MLLTAVNINKKYGGKFFRESRLVDNESIDATCENLYRLDRLDRLVGQFTIDSTWTKFDRLDQLRGLRSTFCLAALWTYLVGTETQSINNPV
jgi:hypothetical protein